MPGWQESEQRKFKLATTHPATDTEDQKPSRPLLSVIDGGRVQRELDAVAALVNPGRFADANRLLQALEPRGKLRSVPDSDVQRLLDEPDGSEDQTKKPP
jgi:hypothetical protein